MDQGLPINFENTASTWQNMPGMAAFYTGLQNQSTQDNIRMLQEAFAREQAFKEQQRPLELQKMRGDEAFKAAQAAYQNALARNTGLDSDLKAGVLPSAISAGISKNQTGVVEDRAKAGAAESEIHGQLAAWLRGTGSQYPPTERVRIVMDRLGVKDPDGSVAAGLLQNINRLPQVLEDQHKHVIQNSSGYTTQQLKEKGDTERTGMTTQAMRDVANINAKARLDVQNAKTQDTAKSILSAANSGKLTYEKAAASFHTLSMLTEDPTEKKKYEELAAQFEQAALSKAAAGVTGKLDVGAQTGLPTQQPKTVLGGNAPAQPKHSLADVQKMYPGVPADKLKQAYKEKFGVDLQ